MACTARGEPEGRKVEPGCASLTNAACSARLCSPRVARRNTFTAIGHTITAVIGAGVLSLPYSIAMLGWVAGPICLLIFAFVTLYTSQMLADCGVINGIRQRTYTNVVETTFGRWGYITIGW